jgi:hypothetical protein
MKSTFADWRVTVYGFLSWAIPFVAAIPFFSGPGELRIPQPLFKSLMVVIAGGVGMVLLMLVFRRVRPTLTSGLAIGGYWLAINWLLDLLILLPMSGMGTVAYFYDIGLRYLLIPMIAAVIGAVAERNT